MTDEQIEREVILQHRRLDALFAAARDAFVAKRDAATVSLTLEQLQDALEVHFLQEDELYYPALWALRPEQRERLESCVAVHQHFRDLMRDLGGRATRGELEGAQRVFEALAEDFRRHEVHEEEVLHDLERSLADAR